MVLPLVLGVSLFGVVACSEEPAYEEGVGEEEVLEEEGIGEEEEILEEEEEGLGEE
jgi:hypothetical protein